MSHISVKVKLEGGKFPASNLADWFGFVAEGRAERHRDSIYRLGHDRLLKIRDYPHQNTEIILEHVFREGGTRHSKISVGTMREGPRDSSPQDVLGVSAVTIGKTRRVFSIPEYPSIRVYADELSNGARFLEFQMDIGDADTKSSVRNLKNIVVSFGFGRDEIIERSYEAMHAQSLFKEASPYTESYSYLSPEIQAKIRRSPTMKPKSDGVLLEKDSEGQTALLITQGRAFVQPDGIILRPGQLVGEFAAFTNGRRAANVSLSADFKGYILDKPLLMDLMTQIPANSEKLLKWSQAQALKTSHAP